MGSHGYALKRITVIFCCHVYWTIRLQQTQQIYTEHLKNIFPLESFSF